MFRANHGSVEDTIMSFANISIVSVLSNTNRNCVPYIDAWLDQCPNTRLNSRITMTIFECLTCEPFGTCSPPTPVELINSPWSHTYTLNHPNCIPKQSHCAKPMWVYIMDDMARQYINLLPIRQNKWMSALRPTIDEFDRPQNHKGLLNRRYLSNHRCRRNSWVGGSHTNIVLYFVVVSGLPKLS